MKPIVTAFETSPDEGEGHARDMRVRWALEEVGQPYDVCLLSFEALKEPAHLARNPFGSIPTFEQDGLVLFESGSIVLRIAEQHPGLLPQDPDARARAVTWIFAALNTLEPPIVERETTMVLEKKEPWYATRLLILDDRVRARLEALSARLGDGEWLDGAFSAGDLMMVMVLRRLEASNSPDGPRLLGEYPALDAYVSRGEARPAYKRAFAAQRAVFEASVRPDKRA
jgi:glutathione S-transferase